MLSFALLSYQQVMRQLERDADGAPRAGCEAARHGRARAPAAARGQRSRRLDADALAHARPRSRSRFRGIELRGRAGSTQRELAHLAGGRHAAARRPRRRRPRITLLRRAARRRRWLAAEVEPRFLFVPEALRCERRPDGARGGRSRSSPPRRSAPEQEKRRAPGSCSCARSSVAPPGPSSSPSRRPRCSRRSTRFRTVFPLVDAALAARGRPRHARAGAAQPGADRAAAGRHAPPRRARLHARASRSAPATSSRSWPISFDAMAANIERHVSVVETVSSVGRALSVEQDAERLLAHDPARHDERHRRQRRRALALRRAGPPGAPPAARVGAARRASTRRAASSDWPTTPQRAAARSHDARARRAVDPDAQPRGRRDRRAPARCAAAASTPRASRSRSRSPRRPPWRSPSIAWPASSARSSRG